MGKRKSRLLSDKKISFPFGITIVAFTGLDTTQQIPIIRKTTGMQEDFCMELESFWFPRIANQNQLRNIKMSMKLYNNWHSK